MVNVGKYASPMDATGFINKMFWGDIGDYTTTLFFSLDYRDPLAWESF